MAPPRELDDHEQSWSAGFQQVETLWLAEVVITILQARQSAPHASAAAVSREVRDEGFLVRVLLLESVPGSLAGDPANTGGAGNSGDTGKVIAVFAARRLGHDLADAFGDRDTVILK
jgi:hypothetical protein